MEREEFILYSTDVPIANMVFRFEGDAQHAAEMIARHNRGAKIHIAKLIACVSEPLPALQWSDDRIAGQGGPSRDTYGLAQQACNTVSAAPMAPMNEKSYRSLG